MGCLFKLLILAAIAYFGANAAEVYWRNYQYRQVVAKELRYRTEKSIPEIRQRFKFLADSMGMPEDAGIVVIKRVGNQLVIESHYDDEIILPGFRREVHFEVKAQGKF